jgi:hypothetical protein
MLIPVTGNDPGRPAQEIPMDPELTPDPMSLHPAGSARRSTSHKVRNLVIGGAAAAGVLLGAAGIAGAATTSDTTSSTAAATAAAPDASNRPDPASMPNGPGETVLTGTDAEQVTAAALAEIPDGTIIRVETDSSGAGTYEAHVKKADGTTVTLLFDASYNLTSTVDGFGGPGPGGQPPMGQPPTGGAPTGAAPASGGSTTTAPAA